MKESGDEKKSSGKDSKKSDSKKSEGKKQSDTKKEGRRHSKESPTRSLERPIFPLSPPIVTRSPATPTKEITAPSTSPVSTSTTTTTTSSSPLPSPKTISRLATLAKPPIPAIPSLIRGRNARHSIDVRTLPSYLAKKRHSSFGQFLSVFNPLDKDRSTSDDEPIFEEPIAPTLSLGERVAWVKTSGPEFGQVKWIGRMPQVSNDWTVGVEFDNCIGTGDGTYEGRRYFVAKADFAKFLPLSSLTKVDLYVGRPRSGTMLSRMSVQLKPGQLISIQRSPSVHIQHCSLNAPHHVGHDVHAPNIRHCMCPSCNHPCAHLCRTRRPKGRRYDAMAHLCHFSSKPHNRLCCGGEDLPCATQPITQTGTSWMHNTAISSLKTVQMVHSHPPSYVGGDHGGSTDRERRKSVTIVGDDRKVASAPTSVERIKSPSTVSPAMAKRRDSDLSISSLPSTTNSPVDAYIARGALTDESDLDTTERSSSPHYKSKSTRGGGLRSLVSCFSVQTPRHRKKHHKRRERARRKKRSNKVAGASSRRPRRGLSSDTSVDGEVTHCSHCQMSSRNSSSRKDNSPIRPKTLSAVTRPPPNSPNLTDSDRHSREPETKSKQETILEGYENGNSNGDDQVEGSNDDCISKSSRGHVITTKADIESTVARRSPASPCHSLASTTTTVSGSLSTPRRRSNKGPAPAPPNGQQSASRSPTGSSQSVSLSYSSSSLPSPQRKRPSPKKSPAPSPPPATASVVLSRSMSEHKKLNLKNVINAVPTFRSEVDLQAAARKSQNSLDVSVDVDYKIDSSPTEEEAVVALTHNNQVNHHYQVPVEIISLDHLISKKIDVSIQVEMADGCKVRNLEKEKNKPKPLKLPKKTFDPIAMFGCDIRSTSFSPKFARSFSECQYIRHQNSPTVKNDQSNVFKPIDLDTFSRELDALLSPKHEIIKSCVGSSLLKRGSDGSLASAATVIEFLSALTDLETEMMLTDDERSIRSDNNNNKNNIHSDSATTNDELATVKSMPINWRYSSSSLDSTNSASEANLLPKTMSRTKRDFRRLIDQRSPVAGAGMMNHVNDRLSSDQSSYSSSSTLSAPSPNRSLTSTPTLTDNRPATATSIGDDVEPSCRRESSSPKSSFPNPNYSSPVPKPRSKNNCLNLDGNRHVRNEKQHSPVENSLCNNSDSNKMNRQCVRNAGPGLHLADSLVPDEAHIARLMEQLEVAIAHGQHRRAAVLARELAMRKVTCTLNRLAATAPNANQPIVAYLYIENKKTHQGPIPLQVYPSMSVDMLKMKVEKEFDIPMPVQRWILGKSFATNPNASLATYGVTSSGCPIFLYLSAPNELNTHDHDQDENFIKLNNISDQKSDDHNHEQSTSALNQLTDASEVNFLNDNLDLITNDKLLANSDPLIFDGLIKPEVVENNSPKTYQELIDLDDVNYVANVDPFDCPVCFNEIAVGDGIVLRDCLHVFCKECLTNAVEYAEEADVKCPFRNDEYSCDSRIQDREVKGLVSPALYDKYLQRSVAKAESKTERSFHCKTPDCPGWCEYDDNVNVFPCPVCRHENCLTCQAIHEKVNCKQYQDELEFQASANDEAKKTKEFLDAMLASGEALRCPQCQVVLMKKWGCDWVKCSMCSTEICWVTGGPRWGPKGHGDTSAGCRCMVRGVRCHPNCKYCH